MCWGHFQKWRFMCVSWIYFLCALLVALCCFFLSTKKSLWEMVGFVCLNYLRKPISEWYLLWKLFDSWGTTALNLMCCRDFQLWGNKTLSAPSCALSLVRELYWLGIRKRCSEQTKKKGELVEGSEIISFDCTTYYYSYEHQQVRLWSQYLTASKLIILIL